MADDENTRGRGRPSRRGVKLRKRSSIWQHFEETHCNDGSVKCKYCSQVFGPNSQGGNLKRHYEGQCPARPDATAAVAPPGAPALDRDPVTATEGAPTLPPPRAMSPEHEHVMEVEEEEEQPVTFGATLPAPARAVSSENEAPPQAAAAVEAPPPAPPRSVSSEREHVTEVEVDEQVVAIVRAPALSLPRAVSSEHDHVTEPSADFYHEDTVRTPLPLPSPTTPCTPSSGSGRSRDPEPSPLGLVLPERVAVVIQEAINGLVQFRAAGRGGAGGPTALPPRGNTATAPHRSASAEANGLIAGLDDLARMIALGGHDPSILEDEYFKSFVRRLNPAFQLPSRHDIERMCDGVFDQARDAMCSRIKEMDGLVSVAVGKASTMEGEVLYIACHFIDDEWNLHRVVIDAFMLVPDPPLRGPLLGVPEVSLAYVKGVIEHAINDAWILSCGRVLMTVCGLPNEPWINECMKNAFSHRSELFCTAYIDNVLHSIAQCLSSVPHIRNVHGRVSEHLMTRQQREKLLSDCGLKNLWAYDEPWYSCYCSLQVLCTKASSQPTHIEHMLCMLWGIIYRALRTISSSSNPTSHRCLGELFNVWQALQSETAHKPNDESTEQALKDAKKTLYKALEDYCMVWSIPLVLDPREKLQSVELILKSVFRSGLLKSVFRSGLFGYHHACSKVTGNIKKLYRSYYDDEDSDDNAMTDGDADKSQQASDDQRNAQDNAELDRYLKDDPVPNTEGFDILNWWKDHGSARYPRVARMARDALAMPTCSKLSSDQLAQVRSRLRGYSLEKHRPPHL